MASATSVDNFVLVAGGELLESESTGKSVNSARVDIYDCNKLAWSSHADSLSIPRKKMAGAQAGGKAIFGAGFSIEAHGNVAIYDMWDSVSDTWTAGNLSSARMRIQSASLTDALGVEYALFIGGLGCDGSYNGPLDGGSGLWDTGAFCTSVDIYNGQTRQWSTTNLTRGRYEFAVASVGTTVGKPDSIIVVGGKQESIGAQLWNTVEMLNITSGIWSWTKQKFGSSYNSGAGLGGTKLTLFAGGDYQNGTTTDTVYAIATKDVVTPPHPPTYFPDMIGPKKLLVASLLDGPLRVSGWCASTSGAPAEDMQPIG